MLSIESILQNYISLLLNRRITENRKAKNFQTNLNLQISSLLPVDGSDCTVFIEFYLENNKQNSKFLVEQWIFQQASKKTIQLESHKLQLCGKLCLHEQRPLCCLINNSPLNLGYLKHQEQHNDFKLTHYIKKTESKAALAIDHYKCHHLQPIQSAKGELKIISRFYQRVTSILTTEHPQQKVNFPVNRTRSNSTQETVKKGFQSVVQRKNSDSTQFSGKKPLKVMYSIMEDVTLLVEEDQMDRLLSHTSSKDSEFIIQTIDEEDDTDITEWQLVDTKQPKQLKLVQKSLLGLKQKYLLNSFHSHQVDLTIQYIMQKCI